MKHKKFKFEADEIGLVYPIYGHMPPNMVRRFIQKAQLKADYRFAVLTYGNRKCSAVEIWDDVSRKAGTKFDYINTIKMVDNWLPNFDMNEQVLIDKHIPEKLEEISTGIAEKKHWHEPVSQEEREQHQGFLERSGVNPDTGFILKSEDYFTITNACIGCRACVSVCPHEITNFCRREWKPEETVISVLHAYKTVRKKPFSLPRTKVLRYFAMARRIPTHAIATNTFH